MEKNEKLTSEQIELIENMKEQTELLNLQVTNSFKKFQKEFEKAVTEMQKTLDKLKKQIFE